MPPVSNIMLDVSNTLVLNLNNEGRDRTVRSCASSTRHL